ncbi:STAS domain-containing protein [Duganella radicis]|uniref:STAS domain-containing protein n=1 Tax=Duganella radicis TaxID=551988 RepID=A0A6L6PTQ4_9BURK|nr:STAS domain-containing protein [Duganella radicis]MTV42021.1 STAS domain-containing protein [Duganella radicis]
MSQPLAAPAAIVYPAPAGEMTIFTAARDQLWLLDAVRAGHLVLLDLAQVNSIDSAGMQLLVGAKRHARALGHELRLVNHSAQLREVLALCGLSAELDAAATQGAA